MLKRISIKFLIFYCLPFLAFTHQSYGQFVYGDGLEASSITPLMNAVNSNDIEGVNFFAKAGQSALDAKNIGGATALHIAARNKNLELIKILITNGADVNISDNDGWTPLMRAASSNSPEIVSELLTHNADANQQNFLDETAIIQATNSGCTACLESILNYINYEKIDKNLLDEQFEEAFTVANKRSDLITKDVLTKYKDQISRGIYPAVINNQANRDLASVTPAPVKNISYNLKDVTGPVDGSQMTDAHISENPSLITGQNLPLNPNQNLNQQVKGLKKKNYVLIKGKNWIYDDNSNRDLPKVAETSLTPEQIEQNYNKRKIFILKPVVGEIRYEEKKNEIIKDIILTPQPQGIIRSEEQGRIIDNNGTINLNEANKTNPETNKEAIPSVAPNISTNGKRKFFIKKGPEGKIQEVQSDSKENIKNFSFAKKKKKVIKPKIDIQNQVQVTQPQAVSTPVVAPINPATSVPAPNTVVTVTPDNTVVTTTKPNEVTTSITPNPTPNSPTPDAPIITTTTTITSPATTNPPVAVVPSVPTTPKQ